MVINAKRLMLLKLQQKKAGELVALVPGDFAPHFKVASSVNPQFSFDTVGGRYVVLCFFGTTRSPAAERFLTEIVNRGERFDVTNFIFFGVTNDAEDVERIEHQDPGRIYFYDLDFAVSTLYGVAQERLDSPPPATATGAQRVTIPAANRTIAPTTFVLDQSLRIVARLALTDDTEKCINALTSLLDALPPLRSSSIPAPVLIVPYVFEPELCRELIQYYERKGGEDSGFMRDVNGKTVGITDYSHKRRMDCEIIDQPLIRAAQERIKRRIVPAIQQAYQFHATRIERHIVACYDAQQGAHFKAHRDNTTLGTAHRRFAVTLNLNSEEYEGGEIWFPEFSPRKYKPARGAAIIFSCSLLHEVPRVTRGRRYAFLPFLYDDDAAAIRERNRKNLGDISGAGGARVTNACGTESAAVDASRTKPLLDGTCGCGNPDGCGTCLSAAAYQLGETPSSSPPVSTPTHPGDGDPVR